VPSLDGALALQTDLSNNNEAPFAGKIKALTKNDELPAGGEGRNGAGFNEACLNGASPCA